MMKSKSILTNLSNIIEKKRKGSKNLYTSKEYNTLRQHDKSKTNVGEGRWKRLVPWLRVLWESTCLAPRCLPLRPISVCSSPSISAVARFLAEPRDYRTYSLIFWFWIGSENSMTFLGCIKKMRAVLVRWQRLIFFFGSKMLVCFIAQTLQYKLYDIFCY